MNGEETKPAFTEEELHQLQELESTWGYEFGITDAIVIVDSLECPYKDIPSFIYLLKKALLKKRAEKMQAYQTKYEGSTLEYKLMDRYNWSQKNNKS